MKGTERPNPPLMIIQGGAGVGKSKLISDLTFWIEHLVRTNLPTNYEHPSVVKLCPTGKAATVIDGLTMHSGRVIRFRHLI